MKKPEEEDSLELIKYEPARRKRLLRKKQNLADQIEKIRLQFSSDFEELFSSIISQQNIRKSLEKVENPTAANVTIMPILLNQIKERSEAMRSDLFYSLNNEIDDLLDTLDDVPPVFRKGFSASDAFLFGIERKTGFSYSIAYTQPIRSTSSSTSRFSTVVDPSLIESGVVEYPLARSLVPVEVVTKLYDQLENISVRGRTWRLSLAKKVVNAFDQVDFMREIRAAVNTQFAEATEYYLAGAEELIDHWKSYFKTQKQLLHNYKKTANDIENLISSISKKEMICNDIRKIINT